MRVGSLFSGVGGMDLGLERAGHTLVWQCEIDPYCRAVLKKHWPDVPCYEDVREVGSHWVGECPQVVWPQESDGGGYVPGCIDCVPYADLICGGFPCPVVSQAARGRNVGPWLWPEFARVVGELRPRYVLVENVGRVLGRVLGDLAEMGFDAEWRVLPASDFGAPQKRPRVWLVGYAHGNGEPGLALDDEVAGESELRSPVRDWPDPPQCLGVAHGIPFRMDRLRGLGNAVVPQVAEWIGCRLAEAEARQPRP